MKKAALLVLLCGLGVLQLSLLEALLPYDRPHPISQLADRALPGPKCDPHSNLAWEFESDYRQHPTHRVVAYALLGLLNLGNLCLIFGLARAFRRFGWTTSRPFELRR
ncbi:MAG: hypothetical protein DMG32_19660 [Acidobacteria bacterium]|nr:MAG: hypothetical protein DMG32_19660 [Acidobacteriota bacterium]